MTEEEAKTVKPGAVYLYVGDSTIGPKRYTCAFTPTVRLKTDRDSSQGWHIKVLRDKSAYANTSILSNAAFFKDCVEALPEDIVELTKLRLLEG